MGLWEALTTNPSCHLPSSLNSFLPNAVACPPPSAARTIFEQITSPFTTTYSIVHHTLNTLVGLPFLSFLLIPTMTSYSTSLNLLFFYLTWSTLVLSHSPLKVELISSLAIKLLFYILPSLAMLIVDLTFPSLSASLKRLGSRGLPLSTPITRRHLTIIGISVFNVLLSVACQGVFEYAFTSYFSTPAIRVITILPLPWAIVKDLLKGLFSRDLLTWLVHRSLHHPPNNAPFHDLSKAHKSWYHQRVKTPYPLSPSYDHPVVYILKVFLPMYLPAVFWRFHALTFMIYLAVVSSEETFVHSGYAKLPTNYVFPGMARRMDLHCGHDGNFGTWGLVDWMMGTSVGREAVDDLMDEAREGEWEEKVRKQAGRNVREVKKAVNGKRRTRIRGSDSE